VTIRHGYLSAQFTGIAAKKLTKVETVSTASNQREIQGTKPFKVMFGLEAKSNIPARFVWLSAEQETMSEDGFVSWSRYREGKFLHGRPRTPEYHLYYSSNAVTELERYPNRLNRLGIEALAKRLRTLAGGRMNISEAC
jgi:hypothetical protein